MLRCKEAGTTMCKYAKHINSGTRPTNKDQILVLLFPSCVTLDKLLLYYLVISGPQFSYV